MITLEKESFTIKVETALSSTEHYLGLIQDLLDLLQAEEDDKRKERYYILDLIKEMLPKDHNELEALCNSSKK